MTFMMKNDIRMRIRPMMAKVRVFRALSSCFWSPPDWTYLNPAKMMKNSATIPEKRRAAVTIF